MLKYNDIIEKLTDEQKVRILTSVGNLSGKDLKILGIPMIKSGNVKDFCRYIYPHSTVLANAWDPELWERVAAEKTEKMRSYRVNFAIAPGPKIKFSPYRREISEDAYLASLMSASNVKGAKRSGIMTGVSGCYLTESDADWMDREPNGRVINEYLMAPYKNASYFGEADAILTDTRVPNEKYKNVCQDIQESLSDSVEFLLCDKATDETTVDFVYRSIICLEGSANALLLAMTKHKKLLHSIEENKGATPEELYEAEQDRSAISDDAVNRALDKTLEFIFRCDASSETVAEDCGTDSGLRATQESVVLLKNQNNTLPLCSKSKIAIIGDVAMRTNAAESTADGCCRALELAGHECTGVVRGYDMDNVYTQRFADEAIRLSKRSDTVILFLGFGYEGEKRISKTEKLTIPANQLYLADRLASCGKRIIAVLAAGHAPDVEFTRHFSAVLLAPVGIKHSAEALVSVLTGAYNPSGRLAYTLYSGSECAFEKRELYKYKYGLKSGPFIGYRYYDTANLTVGYPFGHGLSYTRFNYSLLKTENGEISFVVENTGDFAGVEVAEIYVGKKKSAIIRPKKELAAFARVELLPGEKKTVTVKLQLPKIYDGAEYVTEKGEYTVYVGSSVSDIRLTGSLYSEGVELAHDGERVADYLQSVSNVTEDNYTLEADYSLMKKSVKNILFGIGSLALAISVAIFNAFTEASSVFLGVVGGILAAASIIFFIIEGVERSKRHEEERKNIDSANEKYFEGAEQLPVLSTERMFQDEFDSDEIYDNIGAEEEEDEEDDGYAQFIKEDFMISNAVREFDKFATERGYKFSPGVIENFFASMATSKLIVVTGITNAEFFPLMVLLSEYFGSDAYLDRAIEEDNNGTNLFFSYDSHGDHKKKNVLLAMEHAGRYRDQVHLAALKNVKTDNALDYLAPFMKYLNSPKSKSAIIIHDHNDKSVGYSVPANLWLVLNLEEGESIDKLPLQVARLAAVNRISYTKCQSTGRYMVNHGFSSYQVEYMLEKEGTKREISEELWKKIDKLEKYARGYSDYRIGNKLWLAFEKQIGMLLACDMDINDAADSAVAAKLLPSIVSAVEGKLTKEDKTVFEVLELVMGEEHIERCREFINGMVIAAPEKKADVKTSSVEQPRQTPKIYAENSEPADSEGAEAENAAPDVTETENTVETEEEKAAQTETENTVNTEQPTQTEEENEAAEEAQLADSSDSDKTE